MTSECAAPPPPPGDACFAEAPPPTARLQVDEEAPIRANTTILLGNLAQHLSEATCKRVLLNAFTRALKDGFPPARTAGLKVRPPALPRMRPDSISPGHVSNGLATAS